MITYDKKMTYLLDYLNGGCIKSEDVAANYGVEENEDFERILKDAQDNFDDALKIRDDNGNFDEKIDELVVQFGNDIEKLKSRQSQKL
jgi:hypothetical protein